MNTRRIRHQFYLPDDLSRRLDMLAAAPGASKTAILTDALKDWLDRKAGNELDQRFGPRLDRQSRISARIERKLDAVTELVGVFVQHQLTLVAHQPTFDEPTALSGRQRYAALLDLVEQRIAKGGVIARLMPPSGEDAKR
ncbi:MULTISPECIES: ribbon-helix-helix protein, CopG family [unclassified Sphingomonas]|uniref:ribbon-helix-helix protein, CopG family n=1 Tax=unclassified Sphingomonas TaxID=196159 RepID=UPI00092B7F54|nr:MULTISPECIES: ribbon-helix-helix protein, CopG family [unclassified Sphingomonas]OJU22125.1 MAG: CopG family transcriptional regulator [Sphingomonas sp. 66-10]